MERPGHIIDVAIDEEERQVVLDIHMPPGTLRNPSLCRGVQEAGRGNTTGGA